MRKIIGWTLTVAGVTGFLYYAGLFPSVIAKEAAYQGLGGGYSLIIVPMILLYFLVISGLSATLIQDGRTSSFYDGISMTLAILIIPVIIIYLYLILTPAYGG